MNLTKSEFNFEMNKVTEAIDSVDKEIYENQKPPNPKYHIDLIISKKKKLNESWPHTSWRK